MKNLSLKNKLIGIVIGVILIFGVAASIAVFFQTKKELMNFYYAGSNQNIDATSLNIAFSIGGYVAIAASMALIIIAVLITRLLKPMDNLKTMSQEIAKGNYDVRIKMNSKGELADLGSAFNKMAARLQKSSTEVERKIKERTFDLEKINKTMIGREIKMIELKKEIKKLKAKK